MGNNVSRAVKAVLDYVESLVPVGNAKLRLAIRSIKEGLIPVITSSVLLVVRQVMSNRTIRVILGWVAIACLLVFVGILWYRGWSPHSPVRDKRPDESLASDSSRQGKWGFDTCGHVSSCEVPLSDGSKAILGCNSSIRYTPGFKGEKREVYLVGNAAFQVAPNASKPFVVHFDSTVIRVLGTFFNIVKDSSVHRLEITVISGTVQVIVGRSKKRVDSAWQAVVEEGIITTSKLDSPTRCLHWAEKNPYFDFHEADLAVVIERLARWHEVTVYNPHHVCGIPMTGTFVFSDRLVDDVEVLQRKEYWYAGLYLKNDTIFINQP